MKLQIADRGETKSYRFGGLERRLQEKVSIPPMLCGVRQEAESGSSMWLEGG